MIPFEEALKIVLSYSIPLGAERIPLMQAINRQLADDIQSDIDMPPFNKAAMDGYACRKADLLNELDIIEEIPAGKVPQRKIGSNQCSRIMTGAMVPEGADFVLMKEHATELVKEKIKCTTNSINANICFKGEDVKTGDIVLHKGDVLLPQHIAILASVGVVEPLVYKLPAVAILSTGDELVEPDSKPGMSQIRNSNAYQLMAQTIRLGLTPEYLGIANDEEESLLNKVKIAIEKYDVTIISGGVSVGDYDYVPKVLERLKVEIKFHGLLTKPGKHLMFGKKDNHFIFGMPGNPVSSFVQFELLTKPLLKKLMGKDYKDFSVQIPLEQKYIRKKNATIDFVPVNITNQNTALAIEYHGSAHIHSYTKAQGIMEIPLGISEIEKGEQVNVRQL